MNLVIFMVPGVSLLFGLPLVILSAQMVLGFRSPLLPSFIRHRSIRCGALIRGLDLGAAVMDRFERFVRPRWWLAAGPHMDRIHSLAALLMATMMTLPIPVLNAPPSLGLVVLAIGMIQRDGVFVLGAYALGAWSLWLFGSLGQMAQNMAA